MADDHPIFLDGLKSLLAPTFQVVACLKDGLGLVDSVREHMVDAVIVDFAMPRMGGLEVLSELRSAGLATKVLIMSAYGDPTYAYQCLEAGADGYVVKCDESSQMVHALREVLAGRRWVSPFLVSEIERLKAQCDGSPDTESEADVFKSLTAKQKEIIRLLCAGEATKRIGVTLGLSRKTVEYHKYKIMRRLGYTTTAELLKFAVRWRLDSEGTYLGGS